MLALQLRSRFAQQQWNDPPANNPRNVSVERTGYAPVRLDEVLAAC